MWEYSWEALKTLNERAAKTSKLETQTLANLVVWREGMQEHSLLMMEGLNDSWHHFCLLSLGELFMCKKYAFDAK